MDANRSMNCLYKWKLQRRPETNLQCTICIMILLIYRRPLTLGEARKGWTKRRVDALQRQLFKVESIDEFLASVVYFQLFGKGKCEHGVMNAGFQQRKSRVTKGLLG